MTQIRAFAAMFLCVLALLGCTTSELAGATAAAPVSSASQDRLGLITPTPGLAGQGIIVQYTALALQQTQADLQVRVVEATAQARQTLDVRSALATADAATSTAQAQAFSFQQTVGAATQSVQETQLAFSITVGAATSAAQSTQAASAITATAVTRSAERKASDDITVWWFTAAFFTALAAIVIWYAIRVGRGLARRADPHHDPNSVRVVRTTLGPVLIIPLPHGGFSRELLAAPALPPPSGQIADEAQFDTDEEMPDEPEDAPMYINGQLSGFYNRAQGQKRFEAEEANRKFVLWFLRKCISVAGRQSGTIPPHNRLGVATETWAKATDMLDPLLEKRRGRNGGTWLVGEYTTLAEVWLAVGERRYVPRPSGKRTVVEHSPAPSDSLSMN